MAVLKEMEIEMLKDYEQLDAERMIYGQETTNMKYSEHPQYAETQEDMMSAFQTFGDFIMQPYLNNREKIERLSNMQDEKRRKIFLERWEKGSKIYNGLDLVENPGGAAH